MHKILITDDVSEVLIEGLISRKYIVDYRPFINREEVSSIISEYEGLIINSKIICDASLLNSASKLRWIARLGSGLEVIDAVLCKEKEILFFNSPEGNCRAVAEHALGMLLSLFRNIPKAAQEVRRMEWIREENRGEELFGKTVAIIGYGHTGSAFASLLLGFGVKVLAYDKYKFEFTSDFVKEATLEQIYQEADVVSIHLPLTEETNHFADSVFFEHFHKPIYLINTSRGKVLCTKSLIEALDKKKVKGAVLDVLENEKIDKLDTSELNQFQQLIAFNNVLITPHIAGWTHQSKIKIAEVVLRKIDEVN
jgi:D-3-phosphoglycerate dehydrogenase